MALPVFVAVHVNVESTSFCPRVTPRMTLNEDVVLHGLVKSWVAVIVP